MIFTWHNYNTRNWQGYHLKPQEAELLFLLVVRADYVSREEIIEFVWPNPDMRPLFAKGLVRQYIHFLRILFGPDIIEASYGRGYRIPRRKLL